MRAGVAKGTIYLHFTDKETLFQELIRTMMVPPLQALHALGTSDLSTPIIVRHVIQLFVREILGTRRRDIIRLVIAEGGRFPDVAAFYYREVVSRGLAAIRALLARAETRGELRDKALIGFPQLVIAPAVMAILWSNLFKDQAPLDVEALLNAHVDILFKMENGS